MAVVDGWMSGWGGVRWGGGGGGSAALGAALGALQRGRVVVEVALGVTADTRAATRLLGVAFGLARTALLAGGTTAHAPGRGWRHGERAMGSRSNRWQGSVLGVLFAIIAAAGRQGCRSMSAVTVTVMVTARRGGPGTFGGHWCVPGLVWSAEH